MIRTNEITWKEFEKSYYIDNLTSFCRVWIFLSTDLLIETHIQIIFREIYQMSNNYNLI